MTRLKKLAIRHSSLALLAGLSLGLAVGCSEKAPTVDKPAVAVDPGRVTLHRLNRVEYNNTVRDLLGTAQTPADEFPSDDRGYGFDNIADVLSLSPLQMDLYQRAAEKLLDEALAIPVYTPPTVHLGAEDVKATSGGAYGAFWNLFSNGQVSAPVAFPTDGNYQISVRAFGQQGGPDPARMQILLDGMSLGTFDVTAVEAMPAIYTLKVMAKAGSHAVAAAFINDYYVVGMGMTPTVDRNLVVDYLEITGPLDLPPKKNPLRDRLVTCDPVAAGADACAKKTIGAFARRAFRRAVTDDEVARYLTFMAEAQTEMAGFDQGIRLALEAILLSPNFLFRVETDASPTSLTPHPLGDFELASRLSYFLWSSMPDDELLAAAESGALRDQAQRQAQELRMLQDLKATALIDNFAGQWLYTRGLDDHTADDATFPSYGDSLRLAMRGETLLFFREFLWNGVGLEQLLTADFSFVNATLAKHYALPFDPSKGADFRKVTLTGERRGLLGQASVLTVTSYPARTSPVKRGKWVLEQLLCSGPPPPPPNVVGLIDPAMPSGTLRQLLEAHRANPNCAVCHKVMDPIGFGLEHFDGIGAWRDTDSGFPVDATGQLVGGGSFNGARELAALINADPRYPRCIAQQLYTYALGRGPAYGDDTYVDAITSAFVAGGWQLKDLIMLIVESDAFRQRRGEPALGKSSQPLSTESTHVTPMKRGGK